jgi:hypothetical protein
MTIAIIGYGSLIWDLDDLAPKVAGGWQLGAGPGMPVEFARVSQKRKQGLVLVVEDALNHSCPTSVIESRRDRLADAVDDLAARERTHLGHIGWATRAGDVISRFDGLAESVVRWLGQTAYEAAVWTDLDGNFEEHTGAAFSHDTALGYLKTLTGASLGEAWRYITYAPAETDTPFRRHLWEDSWWTSLELHDDPTND